MRSLAIVRVLCTDHFRRGDILAAAAVSGLVIALFLNLLHGPYDWAYLGMVYRILACVLPALSTAILTSRASSVRVEPLLLMAGRSSYYLGVLAVGVLLGLFWMVVFAGLFAVLPTGGPLDEGILPFVAPAVANLLLVTSVFTTLSVLCGAPIRVILAIALLIMGLNPPAFLAAGRPELARLLMLLPPFLENIRAGTETVPLDLPRNLIYLTAMVVLGLISFARREFYWR